MSQIIIEPKVFNTAMGRLAGDAINKMFTELYALIAAGGTVTQVNTTLPITGGPITTVGTVGVNAFAAGTSGVVPASGGGTVNFLRADGTWVAPPGGSTSVTQAIITLPAPARQSHSVVVVDGTVTGISKIILGLGGVPPSAVNEWDDIDLLDISALPAAGQFTVHARFLNPISGPLLINYMVG